MNTKKVAILLATYNGEKYLPEFLESLTKQTFGEFQLIVRDDGSSDGTLTLVSGYSEKLNITIMDGLQRLGAARSFFQLLTDCGDNYDYYFFADQDDYWHANKLERALSKLGIHNNCSTLYCAGLELVDAHLVHISFRPHARIVGFNNALVENIATGCTIGLNNKARSLIIDRVPNIIRMHDWWFYIVISAFGEVIYDDFFALKYRQHDANVVGAATNIFQEFSRRTKRFFSKSKDGVFCITEQALEFQRCHSKRMSAAQSKLVQGLIDGKVTLLGRAKLALASNFHRQRKLDTFILRLLFLIGKF